MTVSEISGTSQATLSQEQLTIHILSITNGRLEVDKTTNAVRKKQIILFDISRFSEILCLYFSKAKSF